MNMLPIDKIGDARLHKIRVACAYLFSPQHARDDRFLMGLELEAVKKAFREKAKRYHPDFHRYEHEEMINKRSERFIRIRESYEIITSHFKKKASPFLGSTHGQAKTIAVGGAKGGIGKSIFAANLGVLLSSMGKRTVVVDLGGDTSYNILDFFLTADHGIVLTSP